MKDLWIVASYTFKDMFKKKTFLISNLIILLIVYLARNLYMILLIIATVFVYDINT